MTKYVFCFLFLLQVTFCVAQSFEKYINTEGIEMAARCAHPDLTFDPVKSNTTIFHKGIVLDINYVEGVNTILSIYLEDGIITKTETNYDKYFLPAFSVLSFFDVFFGVQDAEALDPLQKQIRQYYEKLYGIGLEDFDGAQITTGILAYTWANYVIKNDKLDLSTTIGRVVKPEVVKMVDGISVEGSLVFVNRVIESLGIIKAYDPEFYSVYLAHSTNRYKVVKGITMNTNYSNTIDEGHYLALHKSHAYNPDEVHSPYYLASVIIHETVHLAQYSLYAEWFNCKLSQYLYSYQYDPVAIAQKEVQAHTIQLQFLNKLPVNSSGLANRKIRSQKYINDYSTAVDAGYLMFSSHSNDCGVTCAQQACEKMKPLYIEYGDTALMGLMYRLICPK